MSRRIWAVGLTFFLLTGAEVEWFRWWHRAEIAALRAADLARAGSRAAAADAYRTALEGLSERADLWLGLSRVLAAEGRLAEARQAVRKAREAAPQDIGARRLAWELARRARDPAGVQEAARALLAVEPANLEAHRDLAGALEAAGRHGEAEAEYRRLLAERPGDPAALRGLALLRRQSGDTAEALQLLKRAQAANPGDPQTRLALADACLEAGQFGAAAELLAAQVAAAPEEVETRLRLAEALAAARDYAGAAAAYRAVLARRPEDSETRIRLARVLSWGRRYPESIAEYRRVLGGR